MPTGKKWFCYILQCSDDSYYTGITSNLDKRIAAHNAGIASRYTRSRLPVRLVYFEPHCTKSSVLKRELQIKSWHKADKEKLVGSRKQVCGFSALSPHKN